MSATNRPQNGHGKQRLLLLLTGVTMLVLLLAVAFAAAGQKEKNRSEPKKAVMVNEAPKIDFVRGTLRRGAYDNWTLDGDQPVLFTKDSFVRDDLTGATNAAPTEGRTAIINGHYVGATLVVRTCCLLDPFRDQESIGTRDLDADPDGGLPTMSASTPQ